MPAFVRSVWCVRESGGAGGRGWGEGEKERGGGWGGGEGQGERERERRLGLLDRVTQALDGSFVLAGELAAAAAPLEFGGLALEA